MVMIKITPVFVLINETTISLILVKIMCIAVLVHLVVVDHIVESLVQLIGTLFDFELLPVDLVLDVIDPLVELGNVHLSVFKSGLGGLVLVLQLKDLLD